MAARISWAGLVAGLLLLACLALDVLAIGKPIKPIPKRQIKRSDGKRWKRMKDIVSTQIRVNAKKFLEERQKYMYFPVEIDVLLIGFEGDGAFHYRLSSAELDELLAATATYQELCPSVWEHDNAPTSLCFQLSYLPITAANVPHALEDIEIVLRDQMVKVGERPADGGHHYGSAGPATPVYEVDAAVVEDVFAQLLRDVYVAEGLVGQDDEGGFTAQAQRAAIVIINPSKQRMSPLVTWDAGVAAASAHADFMAEWQRGSIMEGALVDQEGGYTYRYNYGGRGASAAWVSSYNFLVVDVSAGPVSYGPLASSAGAVAPMALPRIMPLMVRMAREVDSTPQESTLREHLLQEAATGQHKLFVGQLASVINAATRHVIAPDLAHARVEVARRVLVQLVALHDHNEFNLLEGYFGDTPAPPGVETALDLSALQSALDALVPEAGEAVIVPQSGFLHHHPGVAAALQRARVTWSEAVMRGEPYHGLHRAQHTELDADTLMQELRRELPMFTDPPEWLDAPANHLATALRHNGTRQLPVFVLSLRGAPPGMLLQGGQLVAASHDMVVVLQVLSAAPNATEIEEAEKKMAKQAERKLLQQQGGDAHAQQTGTEGDGQQSHENSPFLDYDDWGSTRGKQWWEVDWDGGGPRYSGHMLDGKPVLLDGASGVTARVMAGLATALGGVVPHHERADPANPGARLQDWRWAVGCSPWGPYANATHLSGLTLAAAQRNALLTHVEVVLASVQARLDALDGVVDDIGAVPWPELVDAADRDAGKEHGAHARRHWLDALANRSATLNVSGVGLGGSLVARLTAGTADVEGRLEQLSWLLWGHDWAGAANAVSGLMAAADDLTEAADEAGRSLSEVAACCHVGHTNNTVWALDVLAMMVLGGLVAAFLVVAALVAAGRRVMRKGPQKRQAGPSGSGGYGSGAYSGMGGGLGSYSGAAYPGSSYTPSAAYGGAAGGGSSTSGGAPGSEWAMGGAVYRPTGYARSGSGNAGAPGSWGAQRSASGNLLPR